MLEQEVEQWKSRIDMMSQKEMIKLLKTPPPGHPAFNNLRLQVYFQEQLIKKLIAEGPIFLGYSPKHFRVWADTMEELNGYESQMVRFLRDLADAVENGDVKDEKSA